MLKIKANNICKDCSIAHLVQFREEDPIIAECTRRPSEHIMFGFSKFEVELASHAACSYFQKFHGNREIEHVELL